MSTVEYKLKSSPGKGASYAWNKDEFYTSAVVVGIDIGLEGIGVWIRKGQTPLFGRTFLFEIPEAAPLHGRRGLRAARRCRQAEQRREVMLKQFCKDFGLPWVEITDKGRDDGPFRFRWIATRKDVSGLKDVRAFAACLRHIIRHRGYDWHSPEAGAEYPWGAEAKAKDAIEWANTAFCPQEHAGQLRYMVTDLGWSDKEYEDFERALKGAVERYETKGIDAILAEHFAQPKNNLCPPARRYNFPREMVWDHLRSIVEKHPQFIGGATRLSETLARLEKIINDHRKEPGALAMRKVNRCPLASVLFGCPPPKCDPASNRDIRRFKLLEFLATRTFVLKDGTRALAGPAVIKWLLDDLLEADVAAVASKGQTPRTRMDKREFKKAFLQRQELPAALELASDKQSHNGEFFTQLTDLLWPKLAELAARASLSGRSAAALVGYATREGFAPDIIAARLKEKRFGAGGRKMSLYEIRQTAAAGFGLYKQVEFLLGRWSKNPAPGDPPAVPGKLRQIFAQLIRDGLLPADKAAPDYLVIETVGDIPRNREQAAEIQKEQAARRDYKEKLYEQFKDYDRGGINPEEVNKRLILYDQQRGICPYTGKSLGDNPLSKDLEIDHLFPRSRGGLSELVNLVLTHRETNDQKKERTPCEAFGGKTDTLQWREIKERVLRMQWNVRKRELFLSTEDAPPDWENMTRVAQLGRQLRFEAARWMQIADDDAEVRRRIGTPTGYQTSVCREAWAENLPDGLYPKKDRDNLRHHMWDAAVIAHIPPGKGLNHVRYGGIFQSGGNGSKINMTALKGLGPDLRKFEEQTASRCMVEKIQPAHSKRSRFQQTIYSPPDKDGIMWARDPLDKLADKENLLELLRAAGIDERQLPAQRFEAW